MNTASIDHSKRPSTRSGFAHRRPVAAFLAFALGVGLPLLSIPAVLEMEMAPFLLLLVFVLLLAPALFVTRAADGPGAIRRLLARNLIWRFGLGRWLVILFAMPVLTIASAAATGTFSTPDGGWLDETTTYLLGTLLVGALILNLWEETAWAGFVQTRLMADHGLLKAAILTAIPFAIIHIPLSFEKGWTWSEVGVGLGVLFAAAPFYRYLLGMHLLDTGGSLLAVGIQHASWNNAAKIDGIDGDWQAPAAAILLTVLVAVGRRMIARESHPIGEEAEKAAAAEWFGPITTDATELRIPEPLSASQDTHARAGST